MKRATLKARTLSLVPHATEHLLTPQKLGNLNEFWDGWLRSVSPAVIRNRAPEADLARLFPGRAPLTVADVNSVSRATVRESAEHRHWPPDVVRKFMVAEVITRKNKR